MLWRNRRKHPFRHCDWVERGRVIAEACNDLRPRGSWADRRLPLLIVTNSLYLSASLADDYCEPAAQRAICVSLLSTQWVGTDTRAASMRRCANWYTSITDFIYLFRETEQNGTDIGFVCGEHKNKYIFEVF
jgi:hypothetical protein